MKTKTLAISLALGDLYHNGGNGPLITNPMDGAVTRFQAITEDLEPDQSVLVVCTAGYQAQSPTIECQDRPISLAGQLHRYVKDHDSKWLERLCAVPLCWNTRNEIRHGIRLAIREGFASRNEHVHVLISSTWTHCLRISLCMKLYVPKNWTYEVIISNHIFSLSSHLREIPAYVKYWLRDRRIRRRLAAMRAAGGVWP